METADTPRPELSVEDSLLADFRKANLDYVKALEAEDAVSANDAKAAAEVAMLGIMAARRRP